MKFFAEAICILLRLYAGLCENIDHLSPVDAGAGTELFHEAASRFIRFGLVYILNLSPFLKGWETTFPVSLRLYSKC